MGERISRNMNKAQRIEIVELAKQMKTAGLRIPFDEFMRDPEGWLVEARRVLAASKR